MTGRYEGVRFGAGGDPEELERMGFDHIWGGGHFYFGSPMMDPLSGLAYMAGRTRRVTLGTTLVIPLLHPNLVAKWAADVDILSGGRVILGVGVGGEFPAEFEAMGQDIHTRGARCDEQIEIIRRAFTGEKFGHSGRHYQFNEFQLRPPPIRPGGPPIWITGRSEFAARRAGRLGDGYLPYMVSTSSLGERKRQMVEAAEKAGRDPGQIVLGHFVFCSVSEDGKGTQEAVVRQLGSMYSQDFGHVADRYCIAGTVSQCRERIEAFIDVGVRHFNLATVPPPGGDARDTLHLFARDVLGMRWEESGGGIAGAVEAR